LAGAEAAGEKLDQKAAQTLKRLLISTACEPSVRMFRVPNAKLWAATVGSRSRGCMSEPYLFCLSKSECKGKFAVRIQGLFFIVFLYTFLLAHLVTPNTPGSLGWLCITKFPVAHGCGRRASEHR
jgi:hypothetical protein